MQIEFNPKLSSWKQRMAIIFKVLVGRPVHLGLNIPKEQCDNWIKALEELKKK